MDLNKDYKQIYTHTLKDYNELSGKVVDKIAFTDDGYHDENMFIITFTDKTFIAIGVRYRDLDNHDDEPQIEDYYVMPPKCMNGGDFGCHLWIDNKTSEIHYDKWIQILKDFDIWQMSDSEVTEVIEKNKKAEEEREYQQYLRLKEKFEKKQV